MPLRVTQPRQQVVNRQAQAHLPHRVRAVAIHRVTEALRCYEVGEEPPQEQALALRLADQAKLSIAEIPQSPVRDLGRFARSAAGEVSLLEQAHSQAPQRGVPSHSDAVDAAADDHRIEPRSVQLVEDFGA